MLCWHIMRNQANGRFRRDVPNMICITKSLSMVSHDAMEEREREREKATITYDDLRPTGCPGQECTRVCAHGADIVSDAREPNTDIYKLHKRTCVSREVRVIRTVQRHVPCEYIRTSRARYSCARSQQGSYGPGGRHERAATIRSFVHKGIQRPSEWARNHQLCSQRQRHTPRGVYTGMAGTWRLTSHSSRDARWIC